MKMINCSKKSFFEHKAKVVPWSKDHSEALKFERHDLMNPRLGLVPHGVIKNTEHGRIFHLAMWLTALRADTRGKLAFPQMLGAPTFGEEERNGRRVRVKLPPTPEAKAKALAEQHALLAKLMAACPLFFAGMLVPEDPPRG